MAVARDWQDKDFLLRQEKGYRIMVALRLCESILIVQALEFNGDGDSGARPENRHKDFESSQRYRSRGDQTEQTGNGKDENLDGTDCK